MRERKNQRRLYCFASALLLFHSKAYCVCDVLMTNNCYSFELKKKKDKTIAVVLNATNDNVLTPACCLQSVVFNLNVDIVSPVLLRLFDQHILLS